MIRLFTYTVLALLLTSCKAKQDTASHNFNQTHKVKTEHVFLLVIDGPRWSESFGDSSHKNVPNQVKKLKPKGVFFNNFTNDGRTYTISGHTAITTGHYQNIDNGGTRLPKRPSIFQRYLKQYKKDKRSACILTSKGKLQVLGNTKDKDWKRKFMPATYCGKNGSGKGYPNDKYIWPKFKKIIEHNHPKLTLINLLDADAWAHQGNWDRYIKGIQQADKFALELWNLIQKDPVYKNKTTLFITNDHGRHLPGVKSGFESHGCNCRGCEHIQLIALGPDFPKGKVVDQQYDLVDITATIAAIMNIDMDTEGRIISDLFKEKYLR